MNQEQLEKLNIINERYKLLKKIKPYITFKEYKLFFLLGVVLMPFIDAFVISLNITIKNEIYLYMQNSNDLVFYLFGAILLLYLAASSFILTVLTYMSYYFSLNNFGKKNLSKKEIFEINMLTLNECNKEIEKNIIEANKAVL